MTERSRFWNGTTVGDATESPYDAYTEFAQVLMSLAAAYKVPTNFGGVCEGELNGLAVTGVATPLTVATGRALVYGTWYENDASYSLAIATPVGATRVDYVVLRKSWALQTVRIVKILGVEGGGAPALTQVAGTTWDIPLATASITTLGVVTVADAREYVPRINTNNLVDLAVTAAKIANLTITAAKIANLTITGAQIAATTIAHGKLIEGTGSGLDADLLDAEHASGLKNKSDYVTPGASDIAFGAWTTVLTKTTVAGDSSPAVDRYLITYVIEYHADAGDAGNYIQVRISVDGTPLRESGRVLLVSGAIEKISATVLNVGSIAAGHTIIVEAAKSGGAGTSHVHADQSYIAVMGYQEA